MTMIRNPSETKHVLSEADDLLIQLNTRIIKDMEKKQKATIKKYADKLKKLKFEVQGRTEKDKKISYSSVSKGIHEAIIDIVTAVKTLTKNLT